MVAPTTFREIQLQLQEVPALPNKPIDPRENARTQRVNINGKERMYYLGVKPERVQNFIEGNALYHHQKMGNMEKLRPLIDRVIHSLSTHIENEVYATPEEMECLADLKGKIQDCDMEFNPTEKTDEEFQEKLTQVKQSIEGIQAIVKNLHRNLYDDTYPLDQRVRTLLNAWDIQPYCANAERELHDLQKNELKKLVRDVDNADQYSITRYNVRDRIVRINEISKTLQRIRDSHPVDPEKPIGDQIRAAYGEHVTWESRKAIAKSIILFPFKLMGQAAYHYPKATAAVVVATVSYFRISIPVVSPLIQAVLTPKTYEPVVQFFSDIYKMGNFSNS